MASKERDITEHERVTFARAHDAKMQRHALIARTHNSTSEAAHTWREAGRLQDRGGRLEMRHVCDECDAAKRVSQSYLGGRTHPVVTTIVLADGREQVTSEVV